MVNNVFTIRNCPLCKESHSYSLNVQKSLTQLGVPNSGKATLSKPFKKLLTCPVKNETFLATLELPQNAGEVIRDVMINSIVEDKKDGTR